MFIFQDGTFDSLEPNQEDNQLSSIMKQKFLSRVEANELRLNQNVVYASRMYPCHICGRVSNRPSDLVKHLRVHTGERPFECQFCQMKFKSSSALYNHLRKKHGWSQSDKKDMKAQNLPDTASTTGSMEK